MEQIQLTVRRTLSADVVVIGGGVAGCAAAEAAARHGASVVLVEQSGTLGGQAGFGLVTPLSSTHTQHSHRPFGGLIAEWMDEIRAESARCCAHAPSGAPHDVGAAPYILRVILLRRLTAAGVQVRLHTTLLAAESDGRRVVSAAVWDKSGALRILGDTFIDGSGDGDLIAMSGASYHYGSEPGVYDALTDTHLDVIHEESGKRFHAESDRAVQPVSLFFRMGGVETETAYALNNRPLRFGDFGITREAFAAWRYAGTCGFEPGGSDRIPMPQGRVLVSCSPVAGTVVVNMSRVTGIDATDADSLNDGEIRAQLQLIALVDFLKTFIPGFRDSYLIDCAGSLGIRESRRLAGRRMLTGREVIDGTPQPDRIARGSYIIDIHDPTGKRKAIGGAIHADAYDIPYACLLAREFDNLLAVGRCISADHVAHSSTRIQGTCILTGQAAGTAAALALRDDMTPADYPVDAIQDALRSDGVALE